MLSSFADGRLFGERTGVGSPRVLALHGWAGNYGQMTHLIDGFNAISLDLPGFGKSPEPPEAWGAADYARAIVDVLDEFQTPPVVVGYSFGGRVAVNVASLYPQRVQALVLVGAPLIRRQISSKSPLQFRLMKWANRKGLVSDVRMEAERRKRGSADYRAATGVMRDILVKTVSESYESQLKTVQCPVEMVWGEVDTEAPLRHAQEAEPLLQSSFLTVIPGGTHWSITEQPQQVAVVQDAIRRRLTR